MSRLGPPIHYRTGREALVRHSRNWMDTSEILAGNLLPVRSKRAPLPSASLSQEFEGGQVSMLESGARRFRRGSPALLPLDAPARTGPAPRGYGPPRARWPDGPEPSTFLLRHFIIVEELGGSMAMST